MYEFYRTVLRFQHNNRRTKMVCHTLVKIIVKTPGIFVGNEIQFEMNAVEWDKKNLSAQICPLRVMSVVNSAWSDRFLVAEKNSGSNRTPCVTPRTALPRLRLTYIYRIIKAFLARLSNQQNNVRVEQQQQQYVRTVPFRGWGRTRADRNRTCPVVRAEFSAPRHFRFRSPPPPNSTLRSRANRGDGRDVTSRPFVFRDAAR